MTLSSKEIKLLNRIKDDDSYSNWFFREAKHIKWFFFLKNEGYYSPENYLKSTNGEILLPRSFDYLERVSQQIDNYPEYGEELLNIIENIVQYSRNKDKINNYYIWWYCVKILNNIPNATIKEHLTIETFSVWLNVWTSREGVQHQTIDDIGEKLLPKFLQDKETIPFAEFIINAITQVRPSTRQAPIFGREDAKMVWDQYWLLKAFEEHAEEIVKKCSSEIIVGIANKLKRALEYQQKETWIDPEIDKNQYHIKISRINLKENEIGYKEHQYDVLVRQYLPEQIKNIDTKNDFWALQKIDPDKRIASFVLEAQDKSEFVLKIKENLNKVSPGIDWGAVEEYEEKLACLFASFSADYSHIWIKSLESNNANPNGDAPEILTIILVNLLCHKQERKILEAFLSDKYPFPIFKRLVLFCVNRDWNKLKYLFVGFIKREDALSRSSWEVEMYKVLEKHHKEFSPEVKSRLKDLINKIPKYYSDKEEKNKSYWKYKWLSPLKELDEFKEEYEENKKKAEIKGDKEYRPDTSPAIFSSIGNKSPLTKEEILKMEIVGLVEYLLNFKGSDDWGMLEGKPDKRGLADMLQATVQENPEKFINSLDQFNKQGLYLYVNAILRGFFEYLRTNKPLSWNKILKFSLEYIKQSGFISEAFQAQGEDRGDNKGEYVWVLDNIAELIKEGGRDNEIAITEDNFGLTKNIFDKMFALIEVESHPNTGYDAVTQSINSTLGRSIEAFIVFSLRVARVTKEKDTDWGNKKYDELFVKGPEAYTWFGRYLPNIRYLDKDFAGRKIKEFEGLQATDKNWQNFMEGYLFGAYVYDEIYTKMRNHYIKAIEKKILENQADTRLVQHVAIGYLRGFESLTKENSDGQPSLLYKMLDEASTLEKKQRWFALISRFWGLASSNPTNKEDALPDKTKEKIINFWGWTVDRCEYVKNKLGEDYPSFLSAISELTVLFPEIDEKHEKWLMLSAPHMGKRHNITFLIDYLDRFGDPESVKRIGKIYKEVLTNTTPTYPKEKIISIVQRIYKKGTKEDANDICNTYGRRGVHFLKEVFEKNQE